MLSLSKQTDYALLALASLARRERDARASGWAVAASLPAKEIAEEHNVPTEFLAKVLQRLAKEQIVTSTFGPSGGYKLAGPAAQISVGRIIAIIDGGVALTQCMRDEGSNECELSHHCSIKGPLTRINEEIARVLHTLTIDDITEQPEQPLVQIGPMSAKTLRRPLRGERQAQPGFVMALSQSDNAV